MFLLFAVLKNAPQKVPLSLVREINKTTYFNQSFLHLVFVIALSFYKLFRFTLKLITQRENNIQFEEK